MTNHTRAVAEAFSGHRFADAYDHLAPAVRWVSRRGNHRGQRRRHLRLRSRPSPN